MMLKNQEILAKLKEEKRKDAEEQAKLNDIQDHNNSSVVEDTENQENSGSIENNF